MSHILDFSYMEINKNSSKLEQDIETQKKSGRGVAENERQQSLMMSQDPSGFLFCSEKKEKGYLQDREQK